jgi:succinate dehydrogenase/fumarate reductase-like Fe-S protein
MNQYTFRITETITRTVDLVVDENNFTQAEKKAKKWLERSDFEQAISSETRRKDMVLSKVNTDVKEHEFR